MKHKTQWFSNKIKMNTQTENKMNFRTCS